MITRGVYAAGLSVLNADLSLDVDATVKHAEGLIKSGLHGVFAFGSTGQSQNLSNFEKNYFSEQIYDVSHYINSWRIVFFIQ